MPSRISMSRRFLMSVGCALLACASARCAGDTPPTQTVDLTVASITIAPQAPASLQVGSTLLLVASALNSAGTAPPGTSFVWSSNNTNVATVDATGLVRALAPGQAVITVAAGGRSTGVTVTVAAVVTPAEGKLSVTPTDWEMEGGTSLQLSAQLQGVATTAVTWSVTGAGVTNAGTITSAGVYAAPATSSTLNVTIRATVISDATKFIDVPVAIVPPADLGSRATPVPWYGFEPRVVNFAAPGSVVLTVAVAGHPTSLVLVTNSNGTIPLLPLRTNTFGLSLPGAITLLGYQAGDLHNFIGYLDVFKGDQRLLRGNMFVNVLDPIVPAAAIMPLSADAQASAHVVNLRYDDLYAGNSVPIAVTKRFYQLFPDDYDFLAVIEQYRSFNNRFFMGLRNNVTGVGLSLFDNGAQYGSAARLQGVVHYPLDAIFDVGEKANSHEIGHRWMDYLIPGTLRNGAHWPLSDIAYGIMGISIGAGSVGGEFGYLLTPRGNGDYTMTAAEQATEFNDLELYLMGLNDKTEVAPHFVFVDQTQSSQLANGGVLHGPVTVVTVDTVIAYNGARVPGVSASQKAFKLASIVLSKGRLLSADEHAFFEHMAARGEARIPLQFSSGFLRGTTKPFFLATRGKATLSTTIR
jgi:hypothetical protein